MKLSTTLMTIAAPIFMAAAAMAQSPSGGGAPPTGPHPGGLGAHGGPLGLILFDANQDGKVTRAEFDAGQRTRFDELDADRNGSVTTDEMRIAREARRKKMEAERFVRLDTDKNGQLSLTELQASRESKDGGPWRGLSFGPGGRHGRGGDRGHHRQAAAGAQRGGMSDGGVAFEEFTKRGAKAFTRADVNKDSVVTIAELQSLKRP